MARANRGRWQKERYIILRAQNVDFHCCLFSYVVCVFFSELFKYNLGQDNNCKNIVYGVLCLYHKVDIVHGVLCLYHKVDIVHGVLCLYHKVDIVHDVLCLYHKVDIVHDVLCYIIK